MYYRLGENHEVIEATLKEWMKWSDDKSRRVDVTTIDDVTISTVFLGLEHNFGIEGDPIVFETMIFGGKHDEYQERYTTWDEAIEGHKRAVEKVK